MPVPFFLFLAQHCSALHLDIQQWECLFVFFSFFKSVRCYGIENQATSKDALPGWLETIILLPKHGIARIGRTARRLAVLEKTFL